MHLDLLKNEILQGLKYAFRKKIIREIKNLLKNA